MRNRLLVPFLGRAEATPALQQRIDAAADPRAMVAVTKAEDFLFSPASIGRYQRD